MSTEPSDSSWIRRLLRALPEPPGLIVFDVDCTVIAIDDGRLRPGVTDLFQLLITRGYRITLWSADREWHVRDVAHQHQLTQLMHGLHSKPPFPPTVQAALTILGEVPLLIVDDDAAEAIADWGFYHIEPFGPYEEPYTEPVVQQKEPAV